jgi:hypothetical protein
MMAKRNGFARLVRLRSLDRVRRYEFGVEALCELTTEMLIAIGRSADARGQGAAPSFVHRYWGISFAAWGSDMPEGIQGIAPVPLQMLLWMCLERISELTHALGELKPHTHWQQVHEMVGAWRDSWGNDDRAKHAQARFSTLTGITRGSQQRGEYLRASLIEALSVVQA